jgi:hypothetical protein
MTAGKIWQRIAKAGGTIGVTRRRDRRDGGAALRNTGAGLVTILILLGTAFTIKAFSSPNPPASHANRIASRSGSPSTLPGIVPSQVIDLTAPQFIGTGDASNGSWTAPSDVKRSKP